MGEVKLATTEFSPKCLKLFFKFITMYLDQGMLLPEEVGRNGRTILIVRHTRPREIGNMCQEFHH